jgi:hypothetical protein
LISLGRVVDLQLQTQKINA